jgi:lipopolysaccharide transport system ATP-binding protein
MSEIVIDVKNVSKMYRLGTVGVTSVVDDIQRTWAKWRGLQDPFEKIAAVNVRNQHGKSDYVWSLKDINFTIERGEAVGIIGRNGAGKSTLLKLLSRVTGPTTGTIRMKGRIASLLEVGTGFHPELTGRENIFMNGTIMGLSRREIKSKLDAIIDFSGVEQYIDTPVKRYSSGMYVRLAFAVAAYLEPDILIVDEVLAVGDAEFQQKCMGKIQEVNDKEGRTVLLVSHNLSSIKALCTSAILIEDGSITLKGEVSNVLSRYTINNKLNSNQNLYSRIDRRGSGAIIVKDIILTNLSGIRIVSPITGEPLILKIFYFSKYSKQNDFLFRLQFVDLEDNILFTCNNEHSHSLFSSKEGEHSVDCFIPKFPLFSGNFFIHVQCYSKSLGVLDEVEYAVNLEVIEGDFFGTGKLPLIKKGVLVEHKWINE